MGGGGLAGLLLGGAGEVFGLDAFTLLFGRAPADMTGAFEGVLIGAAAGLAIALARRASPAYAPWFAGLPGAVIGAIVPMLGGRMLGGSLAALAASFPASRMDLSRLGELTGEPGFGPIAQSLTGALEGALFTGGVALALRLTRR